MRYFFTILGCCFFFIVPAQVTTTPYHHFKHYTSADGLSGDYVTCTFKDSKGFLWIGTKRGLQRFNGSSFETFRHLNTDSNSIANDNIFSIAEDSQHNIWVSSFDGISLYNYGNGRFKNFTTWTANGKSSSNNQVFCFFEDSRGKKWVGTAGVGLYLYNENKEQFDHVKPAASLGLKEDHFHWVSNIRETEQHELVLGLEMGFVTFSPGGRQEYFPLPASNTYRNPCWLLPALPRYPDEVWLTSPETGYFCYNRKEKKWVSFCTAQPIYNVTNSAVEWSDDEWLMGADILFLFNHRTGICKPMFEKEKTGYVTRIYKDNEEVFFISTNEHGLYLLNQTNQLFSSVVAIKGLQADNNLCFDQATNKVYFHNLYYTNHLFSWQENSAETKNYEIKDFAKFRIVCNDFIADSNIIYFASWRGMWRYDVNLDRYDSIVYDDGVVSSQKQSFFDVVKEGNNVYFAGGVNNISTRIYVYNTETKKVDLINLPSKANPANKQNWHTWSLALFNKILFVGVINADSIYSYDLLTKAWFDVAIPKEYLRGNEYTFISLCTDKNNNIWCGTIGNGIYVYNTTQHKWLKHIDATEGFFANNVSRLLCDSLGNVWANSSEGLFLFNPGNFSFRQFTINDGLGSEDNSGDLVELPGNRIAYNNINVPDVTFGIIRCKPVDTAIKSIPITIYELKVLGETFHTDSVIDLISVLQLPPNKNTFSLNYAGVEINKGAELMYSYFLEGAEKNWHHARHSQTLTYVNLDPGDYILHIRCINLAGNIVGKEKILRIILAPAWNQTFLFKLGRILLVIALLFFIIRFYFIRKSEKQNAVLQKERALAEERLRIAADMHDDVGEGLSRIRYITTAMKGTDKIDADNMDKILMLSDESVEKMNEIIWSLNQDNQELAELIYHIRSQCAEMTNNANMDFEFSMPQNIPTRLLGWNEKRNIYLLVKESVNNAIKHSDAKKITIIFEINHSLSIIVKDDGKGFDETQTRTEGNGLLNYKKRITTLNGSHTLKTSIGNGTEIHFIIPLP